MTKGLNIVSRLTFENIPDGTLSTPIPDENQYSNYSYTKAGTVTVETIDGIKFIKLNSTTAKIYSTSIISDQSKKNFQAEFDVIFDNIKTETNLVSIGVTNLLNSLRVVASNNSTQGLRLINGNNQISSYYRFENNKKYTICVGFKDNVISMYIDGTIIGYFYSEEFINSLNITTPSNIILGAPLNNTNDTAITLYGKLGNINISIGLTVKHEESYTKYGTNLVSFLNFENLAGIGTYKTGVEAIYEGIEWRGVESATYSNGYGNIKNISTDLTGEFTVTFSLKKFKVANANIIKYGNYSVDYAAGFIPVPEPDVEVNDHTTAALNFENGLVDQIGTTVWTKEGTADVTSVNKIFGENSFETKALGDSLYTNSNIITGGDTPFTIEFYALIKNRMGPTWSGYVEAPLYSKNGESSNQRLLVNFAIGGKLQYSGFSNDSLSGSYNILMNEINKFAISYDGQAYRVFINDRLDYVCGTNQGLNINHNMPFTFFDSLVPAYTGNRISSVGLIDNINIHDGIATKVRDPDPYEEFLVVDLALDGENNSTKIVDNGNGGNTWTVYGNAKLSTTQKFDGFSSLHLNGSSSIYTQTTDNHVSFNRNSIFTMTFDYICTDTGTSTKALVQFFNSSSQRISLYMHSLKNLKLYYSGALRFDINIPTIEVNTPVNYRFIWDKGTIYLYINNVLVHSYYENYDMLDGYPFRIYLGESGTSSEFFYGYIKNFKIYKGVAIIPENPTGKVQLDFDNNLVDKYGNSTWTNNGVTFDQVNSVKGHAAYFNGSNSTYLFLSQNNNLNFENYNFEISMNFKSNTTRLYDMLLSSNHTTYNSNETFQFGHGTHSGLFFKLGNKDIDIVSNINPLSNQYYSTSIRRYKNTFSLRLNDILVGQCNSALPLNITNGGGTRLGGIGWGSGYNYNGYLDNFKSIKDYKENVIIDKPAVHLPLETNAINTGFTPLTINNVGSPTYTTIDGKKCIKFESGKYLTINSNNIFNLGTSSDFYIEFDFYPIKDRAGFILFCSGSSTANSNLFTITCVELFSNEYNKVYTYLGGTNYIFPGSFIYDSWNNLRIFRKGNITTYALNDLSISFNDDMTFNYASNSNLTYIGNAAYASTIYYNGYMSNFKMFVGTSEITESYNDKKVLDLDFKPTGKSYLFKDNNNKCVIHPVNITQRDYQDSQYCCTFNGVDQYLQLGKNDLLNFGFDDFIFNLKFIIKDMNKDNNMIIAAGGTISGRSYIGIGGANINEPGYRNKLIMSNTGGPGIFASNTIIQKDTLYDITIVRRENMYLELYINGVLDISVTNWVIDPSKTIKNTNFNFNLNNNTYIATFESTSNFNFNGTIYSIKVLRNTTDISLLEDENTDVIIGDTTLTLSNGTDSQEVIFDNKDQNDLRFVHSNDSTKLIVNEQILEVPNVENELNELSLFTDFNAEAKDIKTYNIAFEDEDTFSGNVPIHTQFGEVEEIDTVTDIFHVVDQGDFIVNGFFEGRPGDSRYQIRNRFDYIVMHSDSGPFNYNGINERYIDDYEIYLPDTNETMPIPTEPMIRGYITVSITPTECEDINFGVKVFRRSDNKLIGIYDFNNYICTIDNLDCNKRYDCIIFDQDVNLESRCLSNRTPIPY